MDYSQNGKRMKWEVADVISSKTWKLWGDTLELNGYLNLIDSISEDYVEMHPIPTKFEGIIFSDSTSYSSSPYRKVIWHKSKDQVTKPGKDDPTFIGSR